MTNHETAAVDRIPLARSVAYAVKGVPDVPAEHTKGLTLAPTEITLTYRSTTDSQLGRVHAYVKGWWMRNGERYPTEKPMGQHYYGGPDGWPEWLAEEARLHDPEPAVSVPPPAPRADDQAVLRQRIAEVLWPLTEWDGDQLNAERAADAVLAVLPEPADQAAALNRAADEVFALDYDAMVGEEGDENLGSMREAWDLGTIHATKLLRRLADEAAVVPPPALTEEGRLRAQVEVLQQDAERDRGLAKVGARCMRDGHQGLIEQGRLVLEGWRFALSTALGLGTGAPWEAIHERVKELTAAVDTSEDRCAECGHFRGAHEEAEEPVSVGRCTVCADEDERHDFEAVEESRRLATVSGPCVAGEQQNETPEADDYERTTGHLITCLAVAGGGSDPDCPCARPRP